MISVSKIFEILPGHGLELCNMSISQQGIPYRLKTMAWHAELIL